MVIMWTSVLVHTQTHTDTHIDMDALQSFTTGQNFLYAAEIFKILTHSQHPDREDRDEQVRDVIFLFTFFFFRKITDCDSFYEGFE